MLPRFVLLAVCISLPAYAAGPDPRQNWRSADTPHFRINYLADQRAQAERAAIHAENAYARITRQLSWQPEGKTEVLILDAFDIPNGYSTPLPFNKNALFLSPVDNGELLDNREWMDGLITHEFTHAVHLDKGRDFPKKMREVFGRLDTLFPNLIQPTWGIEGIATLNESTPQEGKGRLHSAYFEALMRIEREKGFFSLSEINADGRAPPLSKQYLYGVYFYDFLNRKYGNDAAVRYIHEYSDNILPRTHSNPVAITGKPLDELWEEFRADLTQQIDTRVALLKVGERADGTVLLPARYDVSSLTNSPNGVLAVVNDGLLGTQLLQIDRQGGTNILASLRSNAHIDRHGDGTLLIAQPDICNDHNQFYDLYLWTAQHGIKQITECQRYRRAVWTGTRIAALKHEGGIPSLDLLEVKDGRAYKIRTLFSADYGIEAIDVAASTAGAKVALILKQGDAWQIVEFDLTHDTHSVLLGHDAPLQNLRYSHDGQQLEFIATRDGVQNVWRYRIGSPEISRISHTYTGITLHSGVARDGSLIVGSLAAGGTELRFMNTVVTLATSPASRDAAVLTSRTFAQPSPLGEAREYSALRSVYPRSWLPLAFTDRGLSAYGISTYGSDVMRWHEYAANVMWEFSQGELIGNLGYSYLRRHHFSFSRDLLARQWTNANGKEKTTIYDRSTSAQWVTMLPIEERSERRIHCGIGAAQQSTDRVFVNYFSYQPQLERVAAVFLQYDSRESAWHATEYNRGTFARVLLESYRPFNNYFDGHVVRVDAQRLWPIGKTVLSAHWTEAHTSSLTEPFQLGGAYSYNTGFIVPTLNQRNLPLHGYAGSELALRGNNARTISLGWQTPIADIDRAAMSPPVGINRLSTTLFLDAGSVWNQGAATAPIYKGMGIELNAEIKLFYQMFIPMSLGVAHGFDLNSGNRLYLNFGQTF
jgi:hypothetical protein